MGVPAQPLEPDPPITSKQDVSRTPWLFTTVPSLANLPSLSVPCGFSDDGLPFSLQLSGRPFEETMVLRAGHAYEQATDWHTRPPPSCRPCCQLSRSPSELTAFKLLTLANGDWLYAGKSKDPEPVEGPFAFFPLPSGRGLG